MKKKIKNSKNAIVKFFIHIFLIILYILEVVCYSISYYCEYSYITLPITLLIILFCIDWNPVRL